MLRSVGLETYVRNTKLKTIGLLFAYLFVALCVACALSFMFAIVYTPGTTADRLAAAGRLIALEWHRMVVGAMLWAVLASVFYRRTLNQSLKAEGTTRSENPRLFNIVENLAISTGLTVPQIHIIETHATNAFMSGLLPSRMSLTITRGALNSLNDAQLTAVIAHEFVLVLSGEARRMGLASVFTGICMYMATFLLKPFYKPSFRMLLVLLALPFYPYDVAGLMFIAILAAVLGAIALKLLVGKMRVFVADAGSLQLTKDPEALAAAIQIMANSANFEGADYALRPLLFVDVTSRWLTTHPTTDERIAALKTYVPNLQSDQTIRFPVVQDTRLGLRDQFDIPAWVSGNASILPVVAFAIYCGVTSKWTSIDPKEVAAHKDDIQATLEFASKYATPEMQPAIKGYAHLYDWAYGANVDFEALNKLPKIEYAKPKEVAETPNPLEFAMPAKPSTTVKKQEVFMMSSEPAVQVNEYEAHIIAAVLKNKSRLASDISQSAYDCVLKWQDSDIARKLARDWARGFSKIVDADAFKFKRFPLDLEFSNARRKADDEASADELYPEHTKEGRDFLNFLYDKGMGSSWTPKSCILTRTRERIEPWLNGDDAKTVGLSDTLVVAMKNEAQSTNTDGILKGEALAQMQLAETQMKNAFKPTDREQAAMDRLQKASWNNGSKPVSFVWLPALLLFALWRMIKSFGWLVGNVRRLVFG